MKCYRLTTPSSVILALASILAEPAYAVPLDYTIAFDYSSAPITLLPNGVPSISNVNFGKSFSSFEDLSISATFSEKVTFNTYVGVVLPDPSYSTGYEVWPWGVVAMAGVTVSASPSNLLEWNLGHSSSNLASFGNAVFANFILGGNFDFAVQNNPNGSWPTYLGSLSLTSLSVTLKGAEVSAVPEPSASLLMLTGIAVLGLSVVSRRRTNA